MVEKLTQYPLRIILDFLRIAISISLFLYASWEDWKTREITDKVWVIMTICGVILLTIEVTLISGIGLWLILVAISILFSIAIGFTLFYLDFFGGADSKALIALSILMPLKPEIKWFNIESHPFIPIAVFNNSVIGAALMAVGILTYNIARKLEGETLFEDLKEEKLWKKILVLLTGYKIPISKLKEKPFIYPLEKIEVIKGSIKREIKIRIGITTGEEELEKIFKIIENNRITGKIWVTPALPMLIFMTIGLLISIMYGDVIYLLLMSLKG
ncbi:MAG: prepilin peptidase [archaeon GB-1867-035]|nr:prepilin peptidase [Candidatus Culexmicrobium profundum]